MIDSCLRRHGIAVGIEFASNICQQKGMWKRKLMNVNPPALPACLVKGGLGDGLLVCPCAFALVSLSWS